MINENKMTEEEVVETLRALDEGLKVFEAKGFNIQEFSNGYKQGAYTPMVQNDLMKNVNISTMIPDKSGIESALSNPAYNEDKLISYGQSYYFSSLMYKRNHEYLATLPAFELEFTCTNATMSDYSSEKYKKDKLKIAEFLDKFNYKESFKNITWNMLMNETYFGMFRKFDNKYIIQDFPWKYANISGKWEYGLLYDIDMSWFMQPQVDINSYPSWFKKKYVEMFGNGKQKSYIPSNKINNRTGSFGLWAQTDPSDGFWCFKFNNNHNLQVPFFSAMLPEMATIPLMRNLQISQSMAAARKLLVSSIPYLNDKKGSTIANSLAIDSDVLGKFLGLAQMGLEQAIKLIALPTEDVKGVEFKNTDTETYKNFMEITSSLLSGGKVIFSAGTRMNALETQYSLNLDELLIESIYPQFENFLDYWANKETKKFKWKFKIVGTNSFEDKKRRKEEAMAWAGLGIVLPNKIASSLGMTEIELQRQLEESKASGFTDNLQLLLNVNTASSNDSKNNGRPQKDSSELTDSGTDTRNNGSNIEKGGNI